MTKPPDAWLQRVREIAAMHDGYFRLPAYCRHWPRALAYYTGRLTRTEEDYAACAYLESSGEAVWNPSELGPGIRIVRDPTPPLPVPGEMPLEQALHLLALVHTEDDSLTGFRVHIGISLALWEVAQTDYLRAWAAVRRHLHLQVGPPEDKQP
jgi:hypothetical protein